MSRLPTLFNADGQIGFGARGTPDFVDAAALLRNMDRLGISRTLVWHTQARDHHPATGNRRLLEELDALPAAERARLAPSFVVASCMLHEGHSVDELVTAMRSGRVRALRAFPGSLRYKLRHLQPLLEKVQAYKPVLFVDIRDGADDLDVLAVATAFPEMPVVCMGGMWPQVFNFSLLDLLHRRKNIYIDNSWLHVHRTIEYVAREFGPERIVFATGAKAHNGAAIAGLIDADIDAGVRDGIARGNLERLLGLNATPPFPTEKEGAVGGPNDLWRGYLAGHRPPVEVVDAHGHLGSNGWWAIPERDMDEQIPALERLLDRLGIGLFITSGQEALFGDPLRGNRLLEEAASGCERIRGYFTFNPAYHNMLAPRLDEFFARPFFVGFKLLCTYWKVPVTGDNYKPALEYANDHRLPILLHTWGGNLDSPAMLKDIAPAYPDAAFLLGHSGGSDGGRREAEALAEANDNVYLEWCGSFCSALPWEETIPRVGRDKVVFGSDGIHHDLNWELGRMLSLDLPAEDVVPALGDNMRRILARRR